MKLKRSRREREAAAAAAAAAAAVVAIDEPVAPPKPYFGPEEPTLQLDFWDEELNPAQIEAFAKAEQEHKKIKNKLDALVKENGGEVVYTGDECSAFTVSGDQPELTEMVAANSAYTPVAPIVRKEKEKEKENVPIIKKKGKKEKEKESKYVPPPSPPPASPEPKLKESKKFRIGRDKSSKISPPTPTNVQSVSSAVRPSEASAIGGLATGSSNKNAVVDLTKDDSKNAPDSREVAFNKLQGKTFPSLVVVARPYLKNKEGSGNGDRAGLDSKVKLVLMHTPTKFTEWLIQQGLVRSEQLCAVHSGNKLKLGMYSDVSKFPYSGGYVWISECCPTRFVSVFSGSLFEGATHPPSVILKLIYHWACQTNVQNVVQWVKVDNLYVKGLFTWLRAACTAALHHHISLMGGSGKKIEVGVISLGTTSHDGLQRQVKVEVLGILDSEAKLVRLRAVEPLADGERNYKKRFQKILEPLAQWVNTDSTILTDLTVDKGTLLQMGFKTIHQVANNEPSTKNSNANIMEYLRRIVPRMFQNTLSLLSRQIIQQFLDELVWREWYGTSPGQAFDNIVSHIGEQTRLESKDNFVIRLNKISSNPFKNWKYGHIKPGKAIPPPAIIESPKEGRRGRRSKRDSPSPPPPSPPIVVAAPKRRTNTSKETRKRKRVNYIEPDDDDDVILLDTKKEKKLKKKHEEKKKFEVKKEIKGKFFAKDKKKEEIKLTIKKEIKEEQMVDLESYYFGQIDGDIHCLKVPMLVQCTECSSEFDNCTELLLHLYSHICCDALEDDANSLPCRYCLLYFQTSDTLEQHITEFHPNETESENIKTLACLLCDTRFSTLPLLAHHMQKSHVQSEIPYTCGVCNYRVSSHRLCIDHYYKHHHNSATLQCPFCLKVVKIFADGCDLQSNLEFFIKHMQKHKNNELSLKCNRCSLNFIHLGTLKEHQLRNHSTVTDAGSLCNEVYLISKPKNKATPPVKDSGNHTFLSVFENLDLCISDGNICKECDCQFDDEMHFIGTSKCTKCLYQTSCWKSLLQHSSICQENKMRGQQPIPLPSIVHCICSFSSDNGNAIALHLAQCERQTAYFSEEQAKANTITVSLDKQSMMDSLCLQRNKDVDYTAASAQVENINDYPAPSSVLNTQLSLDDLAPPSVLQQDQMELEQLKNEAYEQPLATPQVQHEDMDVSVPELAEESAQSMPAQSHAVNEPLTSQGLDSYMDSTGEFEPLPAEPMPQPEFEPL